MRTPPLTTQSDAGVCSASKAPQPLTRDEKHAVATIVNSIRPDWQYDRIMFVLNDPRMPRVPVHVVTDAYMRVAKNAGSSAEDVLAKGDHWRHTRTEDGYRQCVCPHCGQWFLLLPEWVRTKMQHRRSTESNQTTGNGVES